MRRRLLVLVLVLAALAGPAVAAESLRDLVAALDADSARERSRAFRALVAEKDPDALPMIRRALPDFSDVGRFLGVSVIAQYPARQARATWRKLAKSDLVYPRFRAGLWLARRGEVKRLDETVETLIAPGVDAHVRLLMVRLVLPNDPPEVREGLRTLLRGEEDVSVLRPVVSFLHRTQDTDAASHARRLLWDERVGVRALAAALLQGLGDTRPASVLADALKAGVPLYELQVVVRILTANRRVDDVILDAVTERMGVETVAGPALQLIAVVRHFRYTKARPALKRFLNGQDARAARAAFDTLVEMSGPVREDTLQPLLRGPDVEKKLWAAEALRKQDDIGGIGAVVYALEKGTVLQRKAAAQMLGSYVLDLSVPPLLDALEDEHVQVRKAAFLSLTTVLRCLFPYRSLDFATTGYSPGRPAAARAEAVLTIRDWWERHREADW